MRRAVGRETRMGPTRPAGVGQNDKTNVSRGRSVTRSRAA